MSYHIPYGKQEITEADINAVVEVLKSEFLTQGPSIAAFEEAFAKYIGSEYAVAVANGTAALHLCTLALAVEPGQQVITTPITFAASANCVLYAGGNIQFADIDSTTYLIDLNQVEDILKKDSQKTIKGIIPVDFTGLPVNMEEVRTLADKYNCWIIEDACHAPGAGFTDTKGVKQKSGNGQFADLAIFSFHPVKHIAAGEGGMITTNDKKLYEKLLLLRTHGITKSPEQMMDNHGGWYYEMVKLGYNYRITDIQAALGHSQLKRADENLNKRYQIGEKYFDAFKHLPLQLPIMLEDSYHAFHLFVVQVAERKRLYDFLREKGIFTQVHYIPLHLMPYYQQFGWKKGDLPKAENFYEHCLSLPMYPSLQEDEQQYVIDSINQFFK